MSRRSGLIVSILALTTACAQQLSDEVTIYPAKTILTMDQASPSAQAVAVKDGIIVGMGSVESLSASYALTYIDERFEDLVIMPGLIDPHIHIALGAMMYGLDFVPPWNMATPNGVVKGISSKSDLLARISELESTASDGPLILYGYHNLVQGELTRKDLDKITTERPVLIWHYSGHDFYMNTPGLEMVGVTPELADQFHGIGLDDNGDLNGRVYEDALLSMFAKLAPFLLNPEHVAKGVNGFETILRRAGVTTVAEMGYGIFGLPLENLILDTHYTKDDPYRLYLVPEHRAFARAFGDDAIATIQEYINDETRTAPVLPQIKLFTDAAFYSQTMKMAAPGYIGGQSAGTDGLWVTPPDKIAALMKPYWDAGMDIHIHSNGDAAQNATLDGFAQLADGAPGQRIIIEHAGLVTPAQIEKAAGLGVGISAASHYVNYMGDDYRAAIGEKVQFITPLASAFKAGLHTTVHSDAPLAPPEPLRAASVHVTRATRNGTISTPTEQLTPQQALQAITIEAAWSLGLEKEIGSISIGKKADFTVLAQNPLTTPAEGWPEIGVWGVVLGGEVIPVAE